MSPKTSYKIKVILILISLLLLFTAGLICFATITITKLHANCKWDKTSATNVSTKQVNFNDCCIPTNCECKETNSNITCNLLKPGHCNNGYRCCEPRCDSCRNSKCSCYCAKFVSNELCENVCGKCANTNTTYSYTANLQTYNATILESCSLGNVTCWENTQDVIDIWYKHKNPTIYSINPDFYCPNTIDIQVGILLFSLTIAVLFFCLLGFIIPWDKLDWKN